MTVRAHKREAARVVARIGRRFDRPDKAPAQRLASAGRARRAQIISAKSFGPDHFGQVSSASATHDSIQKTQYSVPPITQIHLPVTL
jgi:hypothetical protein